MSYINEIVNVNSFYFLNGLSKLKVFPKQIQLGDNQYTFEDGLEFKVKKDNRAFKIFEMTDGQKTYQLRLENNQWLLVGTH